MLAASETLSRFFTMLQPHFQQMSTSDNVLNMSPSFTLSARGLIYISCGDLNLAGQTTTPYFENLILIYVLAVKGYYRPSEFKSWVESRSLLAPEDWDEMPTRRYCDWKHHVDAAKA